MAQKECATQLLYRTTSLGQVWDAVLVRPMNQNSMHTVRLVLLFYLFMLLAATNSMLCYVRLVSCVQFFLVQLSRVLAQTYLGRLFLLIVCSSHRLLSPIVLVYRGGFVMFSIGAYFPFSS